MRGIENQQIALDCLRLSLQHGPLEDAVERSRKYYEFVMGEETSYYYTFTSKPADDPGAKLDAVRKIVTS